MQLTPEELQKLQPVFDRCDAFVAGTRAAMEEVKRQALKDVEMARAKKAQEE